MSLLPVSGPASCPARLSVLLQHGLWQDLRSEGGTPLQGPVCYPTLPCVSLSVTAPPPPQSILPPRHPDTPTTSLPARCPDTDTALAEQKRKEQAHVLELTHQSSTLAQPIYCTSPNCIPNVQHSSQRDRQKHHTEQPVYGKHRSQAATAATSAVTPKCQAVHI